MNIGDPCFTVPIPSEIKEDLIFNKEDIISGFEIKKEQMKYIFLYTKEDDIKLEECLEYIDKFRKHCNITEHSIVLELNSREEFIGKIVPLFKSELPSHVVCFGKQCLSFIETKIPEQWTLVPIVKKLKISTDSIHEFVLYPVPSLKVFCSQDPDILKWMKVVFKCLKSLLS